MESSLFIFLFWLIIAVIGISVKVSKNVKEQNNTGKGAQRPSLDEILEKLQQQDKAQPTPAPKKKAAAKQPKAAPVVEGERVTSAPEEANDPAVEKAKESEGFDFDPVKMVVYSEIMAPGYEKY